MNIVWQQLSSAISCKLHIVSIERDWVIYVIELCLKNENIQWLLKRQKVSGKSTTRVKQLAQDWLSEAIYEWKEESFNNEQIHKKWKGPM